jgi:hypothetical protein
MNVKNVLALALVFFGCSGFVLAMSNVTSVVDGTQYRWGGEAMADNVTTEGGNITNAELNMTVLTEKWAAFWGNATGTIVLGNETKYVYKWDWNASTPAGEVCVSTAPAFPLASATSTLAATIDTAWAFTATDADSAANTFTSSAGVLDITNIAAPITGSAMAVHKSGSSFRTVAIDDGGTGKDNLAFCTNITSGVNYNAVGAMYEIMVPTNSTSGATETYFFYAELE